MSQSVGIEQVLDQLSADLTNTYGEIIARQARELAIAKAHITNLQAQAAQAESAHKGVDEAVAKAEEAVEAAEAAAEKKPTTRRKTATAKPTTKEADNG